MERPRPVADAIARWKHLPNPGRDPSFRALCGRPGCPGSLGNLHRLVHPDPEEARQTFDDLLAALAEVDDSLAAMEQRTDLPPTIDLAERRAFLAKERERTAEQRERIAGVKEHVADTATDFDRLFASIGPRLPDWVMTPERPHREPGTPPGRSPRPLYYGHPDTGYRISYRGKRSREGRRIGRRAWPVPAVSPELPPLGSRLRDERLPTGQRPLPPCRIVCPVCGSLNEVGLPPGMIEVFDDAPDEEGGDDR